MYHYPVILRQDDVSTVDELVNVVEGDDDAFGGVYFDEDADLLHVNVVDHAKDSALEKIRNAIRVDSGARNAVNVVVHEVPYSTAELRAVMVEFTTSEHWVSRTAGTRTSWSIDPRHNRVAVGVTVVEGTLEADVSREFGDRIVLYREERLHHPRLVTPLAPGTRIIRGVPSAEE
ncbi:hypothetical protein [Actinophytocola xanthii]|uniref:Uncharacterized protein n=1 Tax=Actinophytocola xanthii TaxID=1912961 RepID=A0A1Q8CQ77_9PSEU|nr:hypothetical protein [Actinophytocola xanthii]OLF16500.1 hypothetical protein BU204_16820 [Actinophytocola xanthii]